MRILVPTDPFLPVPPPLYGGVERIVAALVAELRQRGHEVGLVANSRSTAVADYLLSWPDPLPRSTASHVRNTVVLLKAVKHFQPSIVHSFSRLLYLAPLLPSGIKKIMSYGRFPGGRQITLAALVAGASLEFTGCSSFIANMGKKHGGKWRTIPNFVDTALYQLEPHVPADAPLVFLGRVESIKGPHIAIEIAKRAGRRLIIAGNHSDCGPEADYWNGVVKPHVGRDGIDYVGPVDDKAKNELLGRAAAMIAPIQWDEPFGIVFVEALACGTPVITCPRGAAPEIVRDGIDGFLIRDVSEGCRAVDSLAAIDRPRCRARAEQMFSVGAVVPQYEALYEALVQPTAAALGSQDKLERNS